MSSPGPVLAAIAAIAFSAWFQAGAAQAASTGAPEDPVEMELSGLAVPSSPPDMSLVATGQAGLVTVLTPSCEPGVPGGCDWLQRVCIDLRGTMTETRDGRPACVIVLD